MINEAALKGYLSKKFRASHISIRKIGSGVQGTGFLVELRTERGISSFVVKSLGSQGFSHDYPSDRAAVFLLDLDEFSALPNHVKAIDVLAEMEDGSVKSIGGGKEYYLLMERGEGKDYFHDLSEFSQRDTLTGRDRERIHAMASYLASIHATKKDSRTLYWRKLRDTVGHGECLMGVLDMYPEGTLSYGEMAQIIKKSVDWVYTLKPRFTRLSQIHGDFHPGNIWFREATGSEFVLLDRSRGPWGEPADDVTALTINYIFFSIKHFGTVRGPYLEGLRLFFDDYERLSGDREICSVVQPFYAFRGAVVANPAFYPEVSGEQRNMIFGFINNVLGTERFDPGRVSEYLR
jgi:aminoglycoside phosphotransferase (APT) family kinase protein